MVPTGGKYSLELETYYRTTKNRIDYVDGSDLIGTNTIETEILNGEARAYGLEVLLKKTMEILQDGSPILCLNQSKGHLEEMLED